MQETLLVGNGPGWYQSMKDPYEGPNIIVCIQYVPGQHG